MHLNHPETITPPYPQSPENLFSMNLGPGAKKAAGCCVLFPITTSPNTRVLCNRAQVTSCQIILKPPYPLLPAPSPLSLI